MAAARIILSIAGGAIGWALPPRCPGCGTVTRDDHAFCSECWTMLDFLGGVACVACGKPVGAACCGAEGALDGVAAAVLYGPIARTLALKLKYGRRPGVARTMAVAMARLVDRDMLLVPVPLHRGRIWSRGFNQSALIARALAERTDTRLAVDALTRTRATPRLQNMGAAARARTVRGVFAVARADAVRGRRVLLIDDVCTSGATGEACAAVLKAAGAAEVRLLCWARVASPDAER